MQISESRRPNRAGDRLQVTREKLSTVPCPLLPRLRYKCCLLLSAYCLLPTAFCQAQTKIENPKSQIENPEQEAPPAGDWAPELLDAILNSPNLAARDALLDAAFAAGPTIIPQLEAALKDDRTAEFAAQSLAFIGGGKSLEILSQLVKDPRDLDLRRFYYGALGEFQHPQAAQVLLYALNRADTEPDRMVTEAAILALTVRSDLSLVAQLRQTEAKIKDVVIRDDLENALEVIQSRARYLASPEGKKAGASIEQAVRTYFIPALEVAPRAVPSVAPRRAGADAGLKPGATQPAAAAPAVKVEVQNLTFSPNKARVLAHVIFEDAVAIAYYDIVMQKQYGDWSVASVWLGSQADKPTTDSGPVKSKRQ